MISIRGAITVDNNTCDDILISAKMLLTEIIQSNCMDIRQIVSVIFTATHDLNTAYPAVAARELGITEAGLMCVQEMYVEGSMQKCLRVIILAETGASQSSAKHVYMKEAVRLRPEFSGFFAVAIDGPAGGGKGTLAKKLAERLNFTYVDTGAMYRAAAYFCALNGISPIDARQIESVLANLNISIESENNRLMVFVNGVDVTNELRSPEISEAASMVAVIPAVREKLLRLQRDIATGCNVVMEGRDIGAKVLPYAQVKIYLDASLDVRARRRFIERSAMGLDADLSEIRQELEERDYRDTQREHSPLIRAVDSVLIDSTNMSQKQVTEAALGIVYEKSGGLHGIQNSKSIS